jgi:hypothetical protein
MTLRLPAQFNIGSNFKRCRRRQTFPVRDDTERALEGSATVIPIVT